MFLCFVAGLGRFQISCGLSVLGGPNFLLGEWERRYLIFFHKAPNDHVNSKTVYSKTICFMCAANFLHFFSAQWGVNSHPPPSAPYFLLKVTEALVKIS